MAGVGKLLKQAQKMQEEMVIMERERNEIGGKLKSVRDSSSLTQVRPGSC